MSDKYANCHHERVRYSHQHHADVEGCTMACCRVCMDCGSSNFYRKHGVHDYLTTGWLPVDEDRDIAMIMTYTDMTREEAVSRYHANNRDTCTILQLALGRE